MSCEALPEDVLGTILSYLDVAERVRLSCCSKSLHRLVQQSSKALLRMKLGEVEADKVDAAVAWLAKHPCKGAVQEAQLPGFSTYTALALQNMMNLVELDLFGTDVYNMMAPRLEDLPLTHLVSLKVLKIDLSCLQGTAVRLPAGLEELKASGLQLQDMLLLLDLPRLTQLQKLQLHAADAQQASAVTQLSALTALRECHLSAFDLVPDSLESLTTLPSLHQLSLECAGVISKAGCSQLAVALSAGACGLLHVKDMRGLALTINCQFRCDGLSQDFSMLTCLKTLQLDRIHPFEDGQFDARVLINMAQLQELHLHFDCVDPPPPRGQPLFIQGLPDLDQLKSLYINNTCSNFDLAFQPPLGLHSLYVHSSGDATWCCEGGTRIPGNISSLCIAAKRVRVKVVEAGESVSGPRIRDAMAIEHWFRSKGQWLDQMGLKQLTLGNVCKKVCVVSQSNESTGLAQLDKLVCGGWAGC